MLTRNHRMEALSRAYVQAIAARCGLVCSTTREYDYGIDLTLHLVQRRERQYAEAGFRLDIQLKATVETKVVLTTDGVSYDLDARAYANLRDPTVTDNRILVPIVFPADESLWTNQDEGQLAIRGSAYWLSLRGRPPSMNRRTVRLTIPRANVLSVEGATALMDRIRRRVDL